MSDATSLYYQTILPNLPYARVLAELQPKERGSYIGLKCPACGKAEAFIYRGGGQIICNRRAKCGYSESLWDYVASTYKLTDNRAILHYFAESAGVSLPSMSPERMAEFQERKTKDLVRETLAKHFTHALWEPAGKAAREYLKGRGYSEELIRQMGLGLLSAHPDLPETLVGLSERWPIVFPWRDTAGRITGFVTRAIDANVNPKYRYEQGFEKSSLFNSAGESRLILVEGMLDSLHASALGIEGVAATGGAGISESQAHTIAAEAQKPYSKLNTIILAFDDDKAGEDATARSLARLRATKGCEKLMLAVWRNFGGHKDLDAWLTQSGVEPAQNAAKAADPAWFWEFDHLLAQHDLSHPLGTETALGAAIALLEGAMAQADALPSPPLFLLEQLRSRILETFAIPPEGLESRLIAAKQAAAEARSREFFAHLGGEIAEKARTGGADIGPWLKRQLLTLPRDRLLTPEPFAFHSAEAEWQHEPEGLKTGWPELDRFLRIAPGTLGVVAAKSRHGKTTMMLNMLVQFIENYPEKQFLYFTYEERKSMLALKILNRMGQTVLDGTRWMQQLPLMLEAAQGKRNWPPRLLEARKELNQWMDSGRLWLIDTAYTATDIAALLPTLAKRYNIGAVMVDYAQKIPYDQGLKADQRYLQLKYISQALLEGAMSAKVPVITGCQLNRETGDGLDGITLDHVRESADIAQDANWVLALWNSAAEEEQHSQDGTLDLKLLKNRDGQSGKGFTLNFNRPTLRLYT